MVQYDYNTSKPRIRNESLKLEDDPVAVLQRDTHDPGSRPNKWNRHANDISFRISLLHLGGRALQMKGVDEPPGTVWSV